MAHEKGVRLLELERLVHVDVANAIEKEVWSPGDPPHSQQVLYLQTDASGLEPNTLINEWRNGQLVAKHPGGYEGGIVLANEASWLDTHIVAWNGDMLVQRGDENVTVPYRDTLLKFKRGTKSDKNYIQLICWGFGGKQKHIVSHERMHHILSEIRRFNADCQRRLIVTTDN